MPNQQKKIIFCTAGVLSFLCALGVVTALGTPLWIKATFLCKTGALLVNASGQELDKFMGEMQYGLFHGEGIRHCGLGARPFRFSCNLFLIPYLGLPCLMGVPAVVTLPCTQACKRERGEEKAREPSQGCLKGGRATLHSGPLFSSFPRFAQSRPTKHPRQCHTLLCDPCCFNHGGDSLLHVQRFWQTF
ncbi:clarin-1 isoform X2 [Talpa occidentalis]|uniref:clarin-1 isoform X2 n=1 Tax=Talpa occidentalis TaxID=50954 RepID=UPI00188DF38F|nr:clarin-1 isoform X2 [Talpa occidentalis]